MGTKIKYDTTPINVIDNNIQTVHYKKYQRYEKCEKKC